jgi:hypothetical protein
MHPVIRSAYTTHTYSVRRCCGSEVTASYALRRVQARTCSLNTGECDLSGNPVLKRYR